IYVSLEGVDESKIESEFKPNSFDVKFHDIQGKNYRCAIVKLHKEIVPEKCKVLVKPKRVIITLVKASKVNWLDLNFKEDKLKPTMDKEKDPMAGIMDLMKNINLTYTYYACKCNEMQNMYEDGDEEMKKTIAKAWTDARTGKTADPLSSYR
ncbi:calcyclin-binding protein, partial [Trifolium pratense]